ncbi:hypothetical protein PtA15_5A715 [Puccinia triticina]|uniref:Uncharacterized protein n=1 Tax=Puccinia triticina TaxID=208348 RepID=A0ABY7CIU3_9BASI|nr:uncharacterized protein PtA15_5A715 [Puccinia triticina]WAQ85141.1 hypothetical protein PtA15_5A715 [Puccinia triticina]
MSFTTYQNLLIQPSLDEFLPLPYHRRRRPLLNENVALAHSARDQPDLFPRVRPRSAQLNHKIADYDQNNISLRRDPSLRLTSSGSLTDFRAFRRGREPDDKLLDRFLSWVHISESACHPSRRPALGGQCLSTLISPSARSLPLSEGEFLWFEEEDGIEE